MVSQGYRVKLCGDVFSPCALWKETHRTHAEKLAFIAHPETVRHKLQIPHINFYFLGGGRIGRCTQIFTFLCATKIFLKIDNMNFPL